MSIYKLQNKEKQVYDSIFSAIQSRKTCAQIPNISADHVLKIYKKVLSESSFGYLYNQNQIQTRMNFRRSEVVFNLCDEIINSRIIADRQTISEIEKITDIARREQTVLGAIRMVYSYFVDHFNYAYDEINNLKYHSALSVFLYRISVCEGFSLALSIVLNRLGIPCGIVTGSSNLNDTNGPHAWNIVEIGSNYYHLDVTWDICTKREQSSLYDYFLLDDYTVRKDHIWDDDSIPSASDQSLEMYTYNNFCCRDRKSCRNVISQGLSQHKDIVGFRYVGNVTEEFLASENIIDMFKESAENTRVSYREINYGVNQTSGTVKFQISYW